MAEMMVNVKLADIAEFKLFIEDVSQALDDERVPEDIKHKIKATVKEFYRENAEEQKETMNKTVNEFIKYLGPYREYLTTQQIRTLKGQILAGQFNSARKGLVKILRKQGRNVYLKV